MSFLFCTKAIAKFALRSLFSAVLASMLVLGSQAASQAAIIVGLQQVGGPATADGTNQTLVTARLTIDLNGETAINAASFAAGLSWSVGSGTASVTDLYTVTSAGAFTTNSNSALIANGVGYLFQSVANDGDLNRAMNTTGLVANSQRSIFFTNLASPPPNPFPSVTTDGIIITDVRFAISPGILNATFSVDVLDTADNSGQYFFGTGAGQPQVAFTGQAGTLQVVPEPSTMYSLFAVGLVATGCQVRRLRRKAA
jgi:hypothetical protein